MRVLAIDPGPMKSGFVVWDRGRIESQVIDNFMLRHRLIENNFGRADMCVIENIAAYGMAVGAEVFETCRWIGRFEERAQIPVRLVYRREIKLHLCGSARAKDANVRQALIDKHGPPGTKKNPGPTYGINGHLWAALAVADYATDMWGEK